MRVINNIEVTVSGNITDEELTVYLAQLQDKSKHKIVRAKVTVDGDYVDAKYMFEAVPFDRIRRITGYLVGTTARWGNAKQAELADRTYHNFSH
jgi:hypothetical protein